MPLKLARYPKRSPFWIIRGTVKGVRVFQSAGTTDRQQAEAYRQKLEREAWERGALDKRRPATFTNALDAYLDLGKPSRFLHRLLVHFGEKPLSEIGQAEIDRAARLIYPEAKAATRVRQVYGPMIAILNHAAKCKLPGAGYQRIEMPKIQRPVTQWASDADVTALLARCPPNLSALVQLMTYTGLRISECLRLRAPDFRRRPGWVSISRTKNGEQAEVPLPPDTSAAIMALLPADADSPVFGYITRHGVNRALERAAKAAGVPYLSTHKIGRHTFAARLLMAGYDIKLLKEAGRWKKLAIVDETYGHLASSRAHEAMLSVARSGAGAVQQLRAIPANQEKAE